MGVVRASPPVAQPVVFAQTCGFLGAVVQHDAPRRLPLNPPAFIPLGGAQAWPYAMAAHWRSRLRIGHGKGVREQGTEPGTLVTGQVSGAILDRFSHQLTAEARDRPASTSLRWLRCDQRNVQEGEVPRFDHVHRTASRVASLKRAPRVVMLHERRK